jgi:exosortase
LLALVVLSIPDGTSSLTASPLVSMRFLPRQLPWVKFKIGAVALLTMFLYADIVAKWVLHWWADDSYSHGLLVAPLALYLAWSRWRERPAPPGPRGEGLIVVLLACAMCLLGTLGAELFISRLSLIVLLAGLVWTLHGTAALGRMSFPLLLLASVVPPPVIVYNNLSAPLQLLASSAAVSVVQNIGISVYREGNIIQLANTSLGVAEACSGLRSLTSLTVAALILGYLDCRLLRTRVALVVASIPIAVLFNVLRVAGTAVLAEHDPDLATGFYHAGTGWMVFVAGFGILWGSAKVLRRFLESDARV